MPIDFREALNDRHRWALAHKASGMPVVGCYSAMVPEELIWACGVLPVQLLMSEGCHDAALPHLPSYVCDCAKGLFEDLTNGTYGYLDGVMVSHVCETIRGLAGILSVREPHRFIRVFTAPAGNDAGAMRRLKEELSGLAGDLEQLGGISLSEERLETAISVYNENRSLVERLYRLRGENPGAIAPEQVLCAVLAGGIMPKEEHNRLMREFLDGVPKDHQTPGARILLSGLLFENGALWGNGFFSILRACGAQVVWDDLASGMRYRIRPVAGSLADGPLDRLAASLLGPQPAPLRSPSERKAGEVLDAARSYGAQGVIFLVPKYCDPMLFDVASVIRMIKAKGFPSLSLEIAGPSTEGPMRTRIEAFIELISGSVTDRTHPDL